MLEFLYDDPEGYYEGQMRTVGQHGQDLLRCELAPVVGMRGDQRMFYSSFTEGNWQEGCSGSAD
jgi:hypothetical protein